MIVLKLAANIIPSEDKPNQNKMQIKKPAAAATGNAHLPNAPNGFFVLETAEAILCGIFFEMPQNFFEVVDGGIVEIVQEIRLKFEPHFFNVRFCAVSMLRGQKVFSKVYAFVAGANDRRAARNKSYPDGSVLF